MRKVFFDFLEMSSTTAKMFCPDSAFDMKPYSPNRMVAKNGYILPH